MALTRAPLPRFLRGARLDSDRQALRPWIGGAAGNPEEFRGILRAIASARRRRHDSAGLESLEGRIRSTLGQFDAARGLLDKATVADPSDAKAWAWRGELALLAGDLDLAGKSFERAVACDPDYPWVYAYRSALYARQGRRNEAAADAKMLLRLAPESPAGFVIRAIVDADRGRPVSAGRWLDKALKRSAEGWLYALRGSLRVRWGHARSGYRDLYRAVDGRPAFWTIFEQADVFRKHNQWAAGLELLKKMRRSYWESQGLLLRVASLCLDQAAYGYARRCLTRAQQLDPGDPALYREQSKVSFVRGDLKAALGDLERAWTRFPSDPTLNERRIQLMILNGLGAQARKALRTTSLPPGGREFLMGYWSCRRGRYAQSEGFFKEAASLAGRREDGGTFRPVADFYRLIAKSLGGMGRARPSAGRELFLLGLGMRQPYQVSLETLDCLRRCDLVYNYLPDASVLDFLGLFPAIRKSLAYCPTDETAEAATRLILGEFRRARRVGFITRGNVLMYGRVPRHLIHECRRRGIAPRVTASVSMFEWLPSLANDPRSGALGIQVRNFNSMSRGINPRLPLVVYFPAGKRDAARVPKLLFRHYPGEHPCYLAIGAGGNEMSVERVALRRLWSALKSGDPGATLFVPAVDAKS